MTNPPEHRDQVLQIRLTRREKSMFFRTARRLTLKRGKRVSVGAMLRELVLVKEEVEEPAEIERRIKQ